MRITRFARFIGAAALLAVVALPGTAAAQGGLPGGGGGLLGGGGGGGGGIVLGGGGGGGGGGAALTLTFTLAPTVDFPSATATISVSSSRVDASLDGTGLPLGNVVCVAANAAPIACAQVTTVTGGVTFPHMPISAFPLVPGTTYSITRGTAIPIASVTLP